MGEGKTCRCGRVAAQGLKRYGLDHRLQAAPVRRCTGWEPRRGGRPAWWDCARHWMAWNSKTKTGGALGGGSGKRVAVARHYEVPCARLRTGAREAIRPHSAAAADRS